MKKKCFTFIRVTHKKKKIKEKRDRSHARVHITFFFFRSRVRSRVPHILRLVFTAVTNHFFFSTLSTSLLVVFAISWRALRRAATNYFSLALYNYLIVTSWINT